MGQAKVEDKPKSTPKVEKKDDDLVSVEIVRTIFVEGSPAGSQPVHPGKLTYADMIENAKRKKAGNNDLIEPETITAEIPRWMARKLSKAGAVRIAI